MVPGRTEEPCASAIADVDLASWPSEPVATKTMPLSDFKVRGTGGPVGVVGGGFAIVTSMGDPGRSAQGGDAPAMKTVGRRRWRGGLVAAAGLLELALQLRGNKPFLPKGVYRFRSFKESDEWYMTMLTRPRKHARPS